MNIDDMPAGAEMDRMVAEKVMGVHRMVVISGGDWSPSTKIAHAWEVLDRCCVSLSLSVTLYQDIGRWGCELRRGQGMPTMAGAYASTAQMAICRAALKAKANAGDLRPSDV